MCRAGQTILTAVLEGRPGGNSLERPEQLPLVVLLLPVSASVGGRLLSGLFLTGEPG